MIELRRGAARCTVHPDIGGSLSSWTAGKQQIFRTASPAAIERADPFGMAAFPLLPFSNRIGDAEFHWAGKRHRLRANFPPEPHALHGTGFESAWSVEAQEDGRLTLGLAHDPDDRWPFAFAALYRIHLETARLTLSLQVRNLADIAVPMGGGFHPYFQAAGAALDFNARNVWQKDADGLPAEPAPPAALADFAGGRAIAGCDLDHCYDGWDGTARIRWAGKPHGLDIAATTPLGTAVVYIPPGGDAFCFEPVSHVNNALNMNHTGLSPMQTVAPGERWMASATFTIMDDDAAPRQKGGHGD